MEERAKPHAPQAAAVKQKTPLFDKMENPPFYSVAGVVAVPLSGVALGVVAGGVGPLSVALSGVVDPAAKASQGQTTAGPNDKSRKNRKPPFLDRATTAGPNDQVLEKQKTPLFGSKQKRK